MVDELIPRDGKILTAGEVARRLAKEFAFVKADGELGVQRAHAHAKWLESRPASIFLGKHQQALERAAMLRQVTAEEALVIEFGDNETTTLTTVLFPGDRVRFGYRSDEDRAALKPLVDRCARVLDCDVELV